MIMNLEKYGRNCEENVENHIQSYVNLVIEPYVETR